MNGEKRIPLNPLTVDGRMPHREKLSPKRPAWSTMKANHTRVTNTMDGSKASHIRFFSRVNQDVSFAFIFHQSMRGLVAGTNIQQMCNRFKNKGNTSYLRKVIFALFDRLNELKIKGQFIARLSFSRFSEQTQYAFNHLFCL